MKLFVKRLHEEKLIEPYFKATIGEYHSSHLMPTHCLNAKWRAFKRAITEGKYPDLPLAQRLRMQIGEIIHREIQRVFKEYQSEVIMKIPILDFNIVCRADLINEKEVIDIKTYTRDDILPKNPEPKHINQVNTYMHAFHLTHARIWYINYEEFYDKFFEVRYDPKRFRDTVAYTSLLHHYLVLDKEPEHTPKCRCHNERGKNG